MRVLVVNAGSSSLKHAVVESDDGSTIATGDERWDPGDAPGRHGEALERALADSGHVVAAVGHRVVHGGARFEAPALIDDDVIEGIEQAALLAPLHNRAALEGIDAALRAFPGTPQVACFDTAFHRTLEPEAAAYAIPHQWATEHGIRRFGFHGLNVSWCAARARELLGAERVRRLVVCHLGSGCSVSAVLAGRSVDTSMGFTPLDGVPMATRSGALDPGVLLHLLRAGLDAGTLDDGLQHRAGLLGVSGRSADLREVLAAAEEGDERARLAFEVMVRGIAGAVAAMSTSLGGLDALVFTAGMGEHSARLRGTVAGRLAHLGVRLDQHRNGTAVADCEIGEEGAKIRVLVLRAREDLVVARETARTVSRGG